MFMYQNEHKVFGLFLHVSINREKTEYLENGCYESCVNLTSSWCDFIFKGCMDEIENMG